MPIPGSNILQQALSVIAASEVNYFMATGRSLNSIGQDVTTYAAPVSLFGSFQPISKSMYEQYGLDLQKSYFNFYVSANIQDTQRDRSGDQIVFGDLRFQCESNTEWFRIDGWKAILCVLIEKVNLTENVFGFGATPSINNNQNFANANFYSGETS